MKSRQVGAAEHAARILKILEDTNFLLPHGGLASK